MDDIKVFISYAHEDNHYKEWVRSLADKLIIHGINVKLDQYDLHVTDNIPSFMEKSISESDFVILLISKKYISKANNRTGGVGYEIDITTGEIYVNKARSKFIPILVKVEFNNAPTFLKGFSSLKIDNLFNYDEMYVELYSIITKQPLLKKPSIGKILQISELKGDKVDNTLDVNRYCENYKLFSYCNTKLVIHLHNFEGKNINQLFPLYQNHFLKSQNWQTGDSQYYPATLNERNKIRNTPFVEYVSGNYISSISNWKIIDRVSFENNIITYNCLELSNHPSILYTSRIPFLSILYLFKFLVNLYNKTKDEKKIDLFFSIEGNKDIVFSLSTNIIYTYLFNVHSMHTEMYTLDKNNRSFSVSNFGLSEREIHDFYISCHSLFVSENIRSAIPFLSLKENSFAFIFQEIDQGNFQY